MIASYSPTIVLALWALSWAAGLDGHDAVTIWLTILAVAVFASATATRRWRRGR